MLAAEEKNQSHNENTLSPEPCKGKFDLAENFPFFENLPCQISYEFCDTTLDEVQAMSANQQRHFVMTSKGMTQRKCLQHLTTSCGACNCMNALYKQGENVRELKFSTQCQIEWNAKHDGNAFEYKCTLHNNEPCFSCVQYSANMRSQPLLPLLTQSTYKLLADLKILYYERGYKDKPSFKELLFFIDHINVDLAEDVRYLCKPLQVLFDQCNRNIEHFIVANAPLDNYEYLISVTRDIKKLWDTFDRSIRVCCISDCICKEFP